jgi:hypothetical protein
MCRPIDGGTGEAEKLRVAEVIAAALRRPQNLCAHVWKTLNAILCCRTPALGAHHYRCADCGRDHLVPHSCRNRHCPDCQGANAHEWLERQEEDLLPVPYFHVVFTIPHSLNQLILQNPRAMHSLLFGCASATILEFAHNKLGEPLLLGFIRSVLAALLPEIIAVPHQRGGQRGATLRRVSRKARVVVIPDARERHVAKPNRLRDRERAVRGQIR